VLYELSDPGSTLRKSGGGSLGGFRRPLNGVLFLFIINKKMYVDHCAKLSHISPDTKRAKLATFFYSDRGGASTRNSKNSCAVASEIKLSNALLFIASEAMPPLIMLAWPYNILVPVRSS
jgi:hypothetical protein